jgi:hypothetical protein
MKTQKIMHIRRSGNLSYDTHRHNAGQSKDRNHSGDKDKDGVKDQEKGIKYVTVMGRYGTKVKYIMAVMDIVLWLEFLLLPIFLIFLVHSPYSLLLLSIVHHGS